MEDNSSVVSEKESKKGKQSAFRRVFGRRPMSSDAPAKPDTDGRSKHENMTNSSTDQNEQGSSSKSAERSGSRAKSTDDTKDGASGSKPPQHQTAFDSAAALLAQYGYGLEDQLGKGSYAVVRGATSKKHKRKVAIKIVSKKKAPEDYLTKFLPREIQVLKRLRHPSCISLLEAIETNTRIYLIMNLAENGDLLEYIRERGPMADDEARRLFRQLIAATEYFHGLGIVHRDLKCENLLLDLSYNLVVSDFGFARGQPINAETGKRRLSQTFCGSYAYAPPEILRGKCQSFDHSCYVSIHVKYPFIKIDYSYRLYRMTIIIIMNLSFRYRLRWCNCGYLECRCCALYDGQCKLAI